MHRNGHISEKILWFLVLAVLSPNAAAQGRKLTFSDEFDAPRGAAVDRTKWTAEIGGRGWGNEELQYYTDSPANAYHDGSGALVIEAAKNTAPLECWYGTPCRYTSARLMTKGKFSQKYGRFEARLKVPRGQGVWPAFWMLGADIDAVGWPRCGEIDVMENIGREPGIVHGTVHGPGYNGAAGIGGQYTLPAGSVFADDFHVFAVDWRKNKIVFSVDGVRYKTITPRDLPPGAVWVYDKPFFLILNLALGGKWSGEPDAATVFPQRLTVDYVRVYR